MPINVEILDLRAFLAVFETCSFHKAAELLNVSQPALSRRIKSLEEKIGASLLERTTRRVSPTAVGRQLQPTLLRIVDELETSILSISETGNRRAGQVTIACGPTAAYYYLPRIIQKFNERHPSIRIRVLDLLAGQGLESVARGEAEFGINMLGFSEPDLRFTPLMNEPFVVACRRDHPVARKWKLRWTELAAYRLIGFSRQSGIRIILDHALASQKIELNWFYEVNHISASLGLMEAGLGISVLPRLATPQTGHPVIVSVPIVEPVLTRTIGVVERRTGGLSPAAVLFRDLLFENKKAK